MRKVARAWDWEGRRRRAAAAIEARLDSHPWEEPAALEVSRARVLAPERVGRRIRVHTGRAWIEREVRPAAVGLRAGALVGTRRGRQKKGK